MLDEHRPLVVVSSSSLSSSSSLLLRSKPLLLVLLRDNNNHRNRKSKNTFTITSERATSLSFEAVAVSRSIQVVSSVSQQRQQQLKDHHFLRHYTSRSNNTDSRRRDNLLQRILFLLVVVALTMTVNVSYFTSNIATTTIHPIMKFISASTSNKNVNDSNVMVLLLQQLHAVVSSSSVSSSLQFQQQQHPSVSTLYFVSAFTAPSAPTTTTTNTIGFHSSQFQPQWRDTNSRKYWLRSRTFTSSSLYKRLRQPQPQQQRRNMSSGTTENNIDTTGASTTADDNNHINYDLSIFDATIRDFRTLGIQSPILLQRLQQQQLFRPTKVQIASYPAIRTIESAITTMDPSLASDVNDEIMISSSTTKQQQQQLVHTDDVTIACETGSGKTLAYLLPLIDDILQRKSRATATTIGMKQEVEDGGSSNSDSIASSSTPTILDVGYDYARAIILVPNKELVQQVVRMAAPLCGGARHSVIYGGHTLPDPTIFDTGTTSVSPLPQDIVRMAIMPGGLDEPLDFLPFRQTVAIGGGTQPPIDLLISTPAAIGPLAFSPKHIPFFADIRTIVIDEADMLLDGGYIRPLENVLMGFKRADRLDAVKMGEIPKTQHIFVAATLPNYGLRSVDAYLSRKFPNAQRIELDSLHMARHSGLIEPTVWIEMESKKDRMVRLVELFQSTTAPDSLRNEKVMIFLNSVTDCEASCEALQRAGIHCAPYHAQIPISDRTITLERFRKYSSEHIGSTDIGNSNKQQSNAVNDDTTSPIAVLVCTDLASRGLDVPGVSVVVQLQFCGNVVGHLHRMGRCGRGGNERQYGRGYVFYGMKERALVETVRAAELEQERMVLPGDVVTKDWNDDNGATDVDNDSSKDSSSIMRVSDADRNTAISPLSTMGKVTTAFSRKRGFTKKLKKLRRNGGGDDEANVE